MAVFLLKIQRYARSIVPHSESFTINPEKDTHPYIYNTSNKHIVKLSYQPSYNAHDVLFLQYSQSYPQDFPRMTSLSLTRRGGGGGWLATRPVSRKVIMTSQANNVVRLLIFRRLRRKKIPF